MEETKNGNMKNVGIYLDTRRANSQGCYPLKIRVSLPDGVLMISLGRFVGPEQWDGVKAVKHDQKAQINHLIRSMINRVEDFLLQKEGWTRQEMRTAILTGQIPKRDSVLVRDVFLRKIQNSLAKKTRDTYGYTLSNIEKYCNTQTLTFDKIDYKWLQSWTHSMSQSSVNTRSIHLRNLRSVFNEAINSKEVSLSLYPFRNYKIKSEKTPKRNLTLQELTTLRDFKLEPHLERYRDMFMLSFYLIGINMVDLAYLKTLRHGRAEYRRSKTGALVSVFVEPEAMEIIQRYRGKNYLLNIMDCRRGERKTYDSFLRRCNMGLRQVGPIQRVEMRTERKRYIHIERTPLFPELTTYWARHTWATIAAELDIPKETISAALGHSLGDVTDIYIQFNRKKIDKANRKVLDYLKSGK